jgi:hypothetical protein
VNLLLPEIVVRLRGGGGQARSNQHITRAVTSALFWEALDLFLQATKNTVFGREKNKNKLLLSM